MSSYYDEDDELDIRIHRGRASPQPRAVVYPEHRHAARPVYYHHGSSYLEPHYAAGGLQRSRSTGHRPSPPPPAPVIINKIYNEDRYEEEDDRTYLQLAPRQRAHSRSRSRAPSVGSSHHSSRHSSRDEYELERMRRELEKIKFKEEREADEKRRDADEKARLARKELDLYKAKQEREQEEKELKKQMELERLLKEKKEEEAKEREKKKADEAVKEWKAKEAERVAREKREKEEAVREWKEKEAARVAKEKKEKEEFEKEYRHRVEEDMRKAGMDERQIAVVTKKEKAIDPSRPTYTRMSRRHLSIEVLNERRIDYEFDVDPDYVLIRRWVPEWEQDYLWTRTRELRDRRLPVAFIEGKKKHGEVEFEFVRDKKGHKRKVSPSPLLTFLAGGKR